MPAKPDSKQIAQHMAALAKGLDRAHQWWPRYIYRTEHVEGAAAILNCGEVLCRAEAERLGAITKDCASPSIIGGLTANERGWVRFYFRPRAPTQYRNEGIRPTAQQDYGSHMPVPVYLLFPSAPVLGELGVSFTRGRLRPGSAIGSDLPFLESIPWKNVFHDTHFRVEERDEIVDARHAEILVPQRLSLDYLKYVVCRSAPERDTLISLLDPAVAERWRKRIILESGGQVFFFKRGTHVEDVVLEPGHSRFTFYSNIALDLRGPFALRIEWKYPDGTGASYENGGNPFTVGTAPLRIRLGAQYPSYRVRMTLNGDLAYQGEFVESTEPELLV